VKAGVKLGGGHTKAVVFCFLTGDVSSTHFPSFDVSDNEENEGEV
jgi:hypothetical protein